MERSGPREDYKALSKLCSSRFLRKIQTQQFCLVFIFRGTIVKNLPRKWSCRPFGCQKLDTIGSFGAIGLR